MLCGPFIGQALQRIHPRDDLTALLVHRFCEGFQVVLQLFNRIHGRCSSLAWSFFFKPSVHGHMVNLLRHVLQDVGFGSMIESKQLFAEHGPWDLRSLHASTVQGHFSSI